MAEPETFAVAQEFGKPVGVKKCEVILSALADALLPGGADLPSAGEIGAGMRAGECLEHLPRPHRFALKALLHAVENGTRLAGLGPFSRLSREDRERVITRIETAHRYSGRAFLPLKLLCVSAFLENPKVLERLDALDRDDCKIAAAPPRTADRNEVLDGAEFDVIVVGSGAGGAPVARELARAGWSVAVVEEGLPVTDGDLQAPPLDRLRRFYRDGGATVAFGNTAILMPMGRAVGGTTVINSGTCFRAPDAVVASWRETFGCTIDPEELHPYYDDVEKTIGAKPTAWEIIGGNGMTAHRGAEALGIAGRPLTRNAPDCRGCGSCAIGCPARAKRGVHLNYLPQAVEAGGVVLSGYRAERVSFRGATAMGVSGKILGENGAAAKPFALHARRGVVIAAGSVLTPGLLRHSGVKHPSIGRHMHVHPCSAVTGLFDGDVKAWRGVMQSYLIDSLSDRGILLEATFPPPALGYAEGSLVLNGAERQGMIAHLGRLATIGILVSDTSSGSVHSLGSGHTPLMTYFLNDGDKRRLLDGMALAARILFAAGAVEIYPLIEGVGRLKSLSEAEACFAGDWKASALRLTAYHPLGTVRMGGDARGAIDGFGRVKGVNRLAVVDGSVFPSSLQVNPQVTIMAFATRAAHKILEDW